MSDDEKAFTSNMIEGVTNDTATNKRQAKDPIILFMVRFYPSFRTFQNDDCCVSADLNQKVKPPAIPNFYPTSFN